MSDQTFTITEEHLTLLRHAYIGWDDCEFGAPAIDCKRPYGNSDVYEDMAEILGVRFGADENMIELEKRRLRALHVDLQTVLQIAVQTGQFSTGTYRSNRYGFDWERVA